MRIQSGAQVETDYQPPIDTNGKIHIRKVLHDMGAALNGIELCYQSIILRPEKKADYEYMINIGKKRLTTIVEIVTSQFENINEIKER